MSTRVWLLVLVAVGMLVVAGCKSSGGRSRSALPSEEPATAGHASSESLPTSITPPGNAVPISSVTAIATGAYHTCALTQAATVFCWGDNAAGQLGDGTVEDRALAAPVIGIDGVTQIAEGFYHSCATVRDGSLKCWGDDNKGALGDGATKGTRLQPIDVIGLPGGVTAIAPSRLFTCALVSGKVWCWGENMFGQIGPGATASIQPEPVLVTGLSGDATGIGTGWFHACALTAASAVQCWGNDQYGTLGNGEMGEANVSTPVSVVGLTNVKAVAVGGAHTCVLTDAGAVKCWGRNNYGQVGDGTTEDRSAAVDVVGLTSGVVAIGAGVGQSCALLAAGGMKCWGHDWYGELGDGTSGVGNVRLQPVDVQGLPPGITALAMGRFHTCVLTNAGGVWCWGRNGFGELGDGTRAQRLAPVQVLGVPSP